MLGKVERQTLGSWNEKKYCKNFKITTISILNSFSIRFQFGYDEFIFIPLSFLLEFEKFLSQEIHKKYCLYHLD